MNVLFSLNLCEDFLSSLANKDDYAPLRQKAKEFSVPSLDVSSCQAVTNIVSIKKPKRSLDIGCGIGVSSLAILRGHPETNLTGIDGNLERLLIFNEFFKNNKNVTSYQVRAEAFLTYGRAKYDFAFVDSAKRDYPQVWHFLKKRLAKNAVVIFDDIFIYGYIFQEDAEIPKKYLENAHIIKDFLKEIFNDVSLSAQLVPVGGGLLVVSKK